MLAIMLEISANMTQLNTRVYAISVGNAFDKRDWGWHLTSEFSQRLRKYKFTAVHTRTHKRRFQIYPLWRAFSNLCVYGERFHRLRVDGRPKRIKMFPFTSVCIYNRLRVDGASDRPFANISKWSHFKLWPVDVTWSAIADAWQVLVIPLKCSVFLSCNLRFVFPM